VMPIAPRRRQTEAITKADAEISGPLFLHLILPSLVGTIAPRYVYGDTSSYCKGLAQLFMLR